PRAPRPLVHRRARPPVAAAQRLSGARQRRRQLRPRRGRGAGRRHRQPRSAAPRARPLGRGPARSVFVAGRRSKLVKHLLVTNDFPPKLGGIQSYLWELWRRLPAERTTVLTTAHGGAREWDREQSFRVERMKDKVLWPTPRVGRHIDALADEVGAKIVMLDPALPIGLVGLRLRH